MMSAWVGLVTAVAVAGYALLSGRLTPRGITGPMVFVAVGIALGPVAAGVVSPVRDAGPIRDLLNAALVLVLFSDASSVRSLPLRSGRFLPARLLGVGLPLSVGLGWLLAWPLFPGLSVWELALLGTVVAPADSSVIRTVTADPRLPLLVRQGLNAESGLSDGLVIPLFLVFQTGAVHGAAGVLGLRGVLVRSLLLSSACGVLLGRLGARGLLHAERGPADRVWLRILPAAVALAAFSAGESLHGSGLIAAWTAGLGFGSVLRGGRSGAEGPRAEEEIGAALGFADQLGSLLSVLSFFAFGSVLLGPALRGLTWQAGVFAVLSLTMLRMLPVALCLGGARLAGPTVAYVGWSGPRGLVTIVLGLLTLGTPAPGVDRIAVAAALTVGLNVYAHGASAPSLADRYAGWFARNAGRPGLREAEGMVSGSPGTEGR